MTTNPFDRVVSSGPANELACGPYSANCRPRGLPVLVAALFVAVCLLVPTVGRAVEFTVECPHGDALGWSVAYGGDLNGDGYADLALSAPCAYTNGTTKTGKVIVISGKNRRRIFQKKGTQSEQFMGIGVAFLSDIDGDGRDEIAIGSPGWDIDIIAEDGTPKTLKNAGRLDVFNKSGKLKLRLVGTERQGALGVAVAGLDDITGDGVPDLAVGASGEFSADGVRSGRVRVVSGADGSEISSIDGSKRSDLFGAVLATNGDLDGDAVSDILTGSEFAKVPRVKKSGRIVGFSSLDLSQPFVSVNGARNDRLGAGLAFAGDMNNDGLDDFIVGSSGSDDLGVRRAGLVTLFSALGERLFAVADPEPQIRAKFGSVVATIGDVNGDSVTDFVASAPLWDLESETDKRLSAGRIVALSGSNGAPLWSLNGSTLRAGFGHSLAGVADFNGDGIPDVAVGSPGDAPNGRRGAGRVRILSGSDGKELTFFRGNRGLETRIFAAGRDDAGVRTLLGFDYLGRKRELRPKIFDGRKVGQLSVAVMEVASVTVPGALRVVVGSGFNARHSVVEVYEAARRNRRLARFHAFEGPKTGGVNVAVGQLGFSGPEEIVAIEAYAQDDDVKIVVFSQLDSEGLEWALTEAFTVFRGNDTIGGVVPIEAGGGTVAVGDVISGKPTREEIIAGTERGIPMVRVFNRSGKKQSEWSAYSGFDFQGVEVAVVDFDGDGLSEIVTVPRRGPALVRVFDGKGNRIVNGETGLPLEFFAFEQSYDRGVKLAAADVDFDGRQELLVVRNSGVDAQIKAFEITGAMVEGWKDIMPFHRENVAIAATDLFVRR